MSGAEDLQEFTALIDKANQIMLSSEAVMVEVPGGQQRPTFAKVLADLAPQLSGAQIFVDVASGLSGTNSGSYFSVLSADTTEYVVLYKNVSGSAVEQKRYPSNELVGTALTAASAALSTGVDSLAVKVASDARYSGASDFIAWAVGFKSPVPMINYVTLIINNVWQAKSLRLRIWDRASGTEGPGLVTDKLLLDRTYTTGDITVKSDFIKGYMSVTFPFDAVAVSTSRYTIVAVDAVDAAGAILPFISGKLNTYSGTPTDQNLRGYYQRTDRGVGTWLKINADNGQIPVTSGLKANGAIKEVSEKTAVKSLVPSVSWPSNNSTNWSYSAVDDSTTFFGWAFGFPETTGSVNGFAAELDGVSRNARIVYRVSLRLRTEIANAAAPQGVPTDVPYYEGSIKPSDIAADLAFRSVVFAFPELSIPAAYFVAVEFIAELPDGSAGYLGVGRHGTEPGETPPANQSERGWYLRRNATGTWRTITGSEKISAALGRISSVELRAAVLENTRKVDSLALTGMIEKFFPTIVVSGTTVYFAGSKALVDGESHQIVGSVVLDAGTTGAETKSGVSLQYTGSTAKFASNPNAWLGRRHVSEVTVKRESDNLVLVQGSDYNYTPNGKLRGLANTAAFNVAATYTYAKERYDLIQIDPSTLALSVVKGVERDYDATEYRPAPDSNKIPLYYALVYGATVQLEPVYRYFSVGGDEVDSTSDVQLLARHNRKALKKTLLKISRQQAIKLIGHGDSITAISRVASPTSPNGTTRDQVNFLYPEYPADTMASKYPGVDLGYGDGPVHLKIGWNWKLKAFLEENYGVVVAYENYGLSGSNAASGKSSSRLAPILASGGDLMVLCFGMNDSATTTTLYADMLSIITQAMAVGMEVIVMPVPRTPDTEDGRFTLSDWRWINLQVYRAAIDAGAAYCPANWLTDESSRGGMGVVPASLCNANLQNHPGGYELSVYGKALTGLFV